MIMSALLSASALNDLGRPVLRAVPFVCSDHEAEKVVLIITRTMIITRSRTWHIDISPHPPNRMLVLCSFIRFCFEAYKRT